MASRVYQGTRKFCTTDPAWNFTLVGGTSIVTANVQIGCAVDSWRNPETDITWHYYNSTRGAHINDTDFNYVKGSLYGNDALGEPITWSPVYDISAALNLGTTNTITWNGDNYPSTDNPGMGYFKYYFEYIADPTPLKYLNTMVDSQIVQLVILDLDDDSIPEWIYQSKTYKGNFLRIQVDGEQYCLWVDTIPDDLDSGIHFQYLGQTLCVKKSAA